MGIYRDNGKENGNYHNIGFILGLYWEYIGIMEKNMETRLYIGVMLGTYRDNGKENGNYHNIGFILGLSWGYIGIMDPSCLAFTAARVEQIIGLDVLTIMGYQTLKFPVRTLLRVD